MAFSLFCVAVYAVLVGVASLIEGPVGRGLRSVQLNLLIRCGSLAAALPAVLLVHGARLPSEPAILAGLGIGLITGVGSIVYCLILGDMPISLVVTLSNLYLVVTIALGVVVLREPLSVLTIGGLACTLMGVVLLAHPPASRYGVHSATSIAGEVVPLRAFVMMGAYVAMVGVGAFLEKPALRGLDAIQLNALMAISMSVVAVVVLAQESRPPRLTRRAAGVIGVGALIGVASIFYFIGLRGLPVSIAAASSNANVVVTVLLSAVFLGQRLTRERSGALALTLVGVTLLAVSSG